MEGTAYTVTFFDSRIDDSIFVDRSTEYVLRNLSGGASNTGVELLATVRRAPFALTGTYTYVRSLERDGTDSADVALTPRNSAGVVSMIENETGRLGVEVYVTGRQQLEANPYRETSEINPNREKNEVSQPRSTVPMLMGACGIRCFFSSLRDKFSLVARVSQNCAARGRIHRLEFVHS